MPEPELPAAGGVLMLADYTVADLDRISELGMTHPEPVLPVRCDGGLVLLGPVFGGTDAAGVCLRCAEDARLAVLGGQVPRRDPRMRLGGRPAPSLQPLVAALVARSLADPDRYRRMVLGVRTDLGTVAEHPIRPRPDGCPHCGPLPADSAESARVERESVPVEPGGLRGANPLTDGERLRSALFDLRHGPVLGVFRTGYLPLAVASAELAGDRLPLMAGYGRTLSFDDAERVALFEAVERHNGMKPRRHRTTLHASFAELGPDKALDPRRLGSYEPEHQRHPTFHLAHYSPGLPTHWVHGWSYTRSTAVAVPEHVAYWSVERPDAPPFIDETSNGCGLGNSRTEAVLHGLFEVAERDAFLMAWYAKTPLRQVRVPERDPVVPHLIDRLAALGYELLFFDATNDLRIPAIMSLARYRGDDPNTPRAFFAAGGHPDPAQAIRSAAVEVAVDVESAADRTDFYQQNRLRRLLAEPELIRTMDDHMAVNALPEAASRYGFLFDNNLAPIDLAAIAPTLPTRTDLADLLDDHVRRLAALDLEVIAIDQTDPIVSAQLGLHSVKVIVPGTLPMTFGQLKRRTRGLPRLLEVPCQLGRLPAPLDYDSLALQPHPFP